MKNGSSTGRQDLAASDVPGPTQLIIMGGGGDLAWRKLVPALYRLHTADRLPEKLALVAVDGKPMSKEKYRERLRDGVNRFVPEGRPKKEDWEAFLPHLDYRRMDFEDKKAFKGLAGQLDAIEKKWGEQATRVFYLAIPPSIVSAVAQNLRAARLHLPRARTRVVVEKPFGHDLDSARALNRTLWDVFDESQIYRIDHYLGKETVQNIMALRFANAFFEPIWDRRYIDHVQVTVAETVGVEHRAGYYEEAGAARDMIQNHLLQIFSLIAMEPPVSLAPDEIRNKKIDVLRAVRRIAPGDVPDLAVRGQYGDGLMDCKPVKGYRREPGVDKDSSTETFAAFKLFVDNWRWQDVPFYLRTGKRLPERLSVASVHFRPVPHQMFPRSAIAAWKPNRLVMHIAPDEGVTLRFLAQRPELRVRLSPVDMRFNYREAFNKRTPDAYETLLLDVMEGDPTLFKRAEQVEAAWSIVDPVLKTWGDVPPTSFPNYAAGTWGPEAADELITRDGRRWLTPSKMPFLVSPQRR